MTNPMNHELPTPIGIFPLPLVVFPGEIRTLHIFEPRYLALLQDIQAAGHKSFGIVLSIASPIPAIPMITAVGTLCQVVQQHPYLPDGSFDIEIQGVRRFKLGDTDPNTQPYLTSQVSYLEDDPDEDAPSGQLQEQLVAALKTLLSLNTTDETRVQQQMASLALSETQSPLALSFRVAKCFEHDPTVQQHFLELTSTRERLRLQLDTLNDLVQRTAAINQIEKAFQSAP